ncbi:hypothetical protein MPTK1_6g06090 [Marchantia polymorpha subsp. ruderalis]|uniref:Uncharacterized protein n=2 Tax=Marchantia polymorpha TaxID=3197 RepID=A0AAF6BP28_MARPO|nr:hypothetical protein MARPO_0097s0035 [Marchantia polymorpha]BBN13762.1 hypothetical protein Mp_6g06090 [Marchantia polymorpha subsp. ruderalis]|eukprot:PTQ32550.1 hypothetical protein MARPO_0097s0035 [Marchantia polymorpha]
MLYTLTGTWFTKHHVEILSAVEGKKSMHDGARSKTCCNYVDGKPEREGAKYSELSPINHMLYLRVIWSTSGVINSRVPIVFGKVRLIIAF